MQNGHLLITFATLLTILCSQALAINLRKSYLKALGQISGDAQNIRKLDFEHMKNLKFKPLGRKYLEREGSIYIRDNVLLVSDKFQPDLSEGEILCAGVTFKDVISKVGWDMLYIKTYKECSPIIQMWAAGYLEGHITFQQIDNFYDNLVGLHNTTEEDKKTLQNIFDHFEVVDGEILKKITNENLKSLPDEDLLYWAQVALIRLQSEGLMTGMNELAEEKLTIHDIYLINGDGEVPELFTVFKDYRATPDSSYSRSDTEMRLKEPSFGFNPEDLFAKYGTRDPELLWLKKLSKSHCSAFIKLLRGEDDNINDILFSHSTWDDYSEMLRIFKHYDFELLGETNRTDGMSRKRETFSSYPGCMSSTDDFYLLQSNLVVTETTLEILNENLYKKVLKENKYIPDFMRVTVANRLSEEPKEWIKWMSYLNTGTYNSQWMILDLDRFKEGIGTNKLPENTLMLMEQIPDRIEYLDLTSHLLKTTFWSSFNIPYIPIIRELSGYKEMEGRFGETYSYDKNVRSQIFKATQNSIKTMDDIKHLMLLNPWKEGQATNPNDPVNPNYGSPAHAIAARFDLLKGSMSKNVGAIDTKVGNFKMMSNQECIAISGPTHQDQPPFDWRDTNLRDPHLGLPDRWDFDWIKISPEILKSGQIILNKSESKPKREELQQDEDQVQDSRKGAQLFIQRLF